jgi:predicted CXXCH cytochrome family protein
VAGRTRTAKALAQRIDLNYFKRPHPFRRWKLALSVAAPGVVLLWLGGMAAGGSKAPYSSGEVSRAHQVFGGRCERCHVTESRMFRAHVTDNMCVSCHDAPAHKPNQTSTPACASCHLEHRGPLRLAATANRDCEQCHLDLDTTDGRRAVARTVGAFNGAHPEFAVKREGARDAAVLKFNHEVHMKPDLRAPAGAARLECASCHQPAAAIAAATRDPVPQPRRARPMSPVTYARDCASCHPLYFDPLIDEVAPHETPDKVRAMVAQSLRAFIAANPDRIGKPDPVRGRIPVNFPEPMPPVRTAEEWLQARSASVERLLWSKTCAECHTVERQAPVPRVVPTAVRAGWMPHARFDHAAHQMTACTSCHAAQTSRETSDVLMPSIDTCQQCHKPARGAESRCFECHEYHDWANAKAVRPGFELHQLVN